MPLRTRLILIICLVAAVFAGAVYFARRKPAEKPGENNQTPVNTNTSDLSPVVNTVVPTVVPVGTPVKPATTLEAEQNGVRQLAKVFVERYNSYSTDNNYQNIRDVEGLVTANLWTKISARLKTPMAPSATFSAVTTEVISATLANWKAEQATITIKAKKTSETSGISKEEYQTTSVVMLKQDGKWLVDSFKNE